MLFRYLEKHKKLYAQVLQKSTSSSINVSCISTPPQSNAYTIAVDWWWWESLCHFSNQEMSHTLSLWNWVSPVIPLTNSMLWKWCWTNSEARPKRSEFLLYVLRIFFLRILSPCILLVIQLQCKIESAYGQPISQLKRLLRSHSTLRTSSWKQPINDSSWCHVLIQLPFECG